VTTLAASDSSPTLPAPGTFTVAYLGPPGTFTEQALLTQADLCAGEIAAYPSFAEVLAAVADGAVDYGFVAIENAIEGTVSVTVDTLAFETNLLIQREVEMAIHLTLMGRADATLETIKGVMSFPHASAQCRQWLSRELPGVEIIASNSTSDAARFVSEHGDETLGAIGPSRSAQVYGLSTLATEIEDHPENATRFVLVARSGVPAATGHDKTSIVVFQRADGPGSLLAILQEFAARGINLSKLESRPAKTGLGDYCFVIDLDGHLDDELIVDALRTLRSKQADVKFLGSYPAAGEHGPSVRRDADAAWREADAWIASLRNQPPATTNDVATSPP